MHDMQDEFNMQDEVKNQIKNEEHKMVKLVTLSIIKNIKNGEQEAHPYKVLSLILSPS